MNNMVTMLTTCHAKLLQSCPTLCNPMDHSPPGSSVHGILQARILEWVAMPSSRGSSQPREDQTRVSCVSFIGIQVLCHQHHPGSPIVNNQFRSVARSCPTLCSPMDCSIPGFPVHHQLLELAQTHVHQLVMPSNHPILCPILLLPSVLPSIRVFSNDLVLHIRWPKYSSFSFSISPSNDF